MSSKTHEGITPSHALPHTRRLIILITMGVLLFGISLTLFLCGQAAVSFHLMWILSFLLSACGIGLFLYSTFKRPGSSIKNKLYIPLFYWY